VLIRANPWQEFSRSPQKQMRPRTSHPEPHRSWISHLAFPPLGASRRRYRSDSTHKECHFYQYRSQTRDSENHCSATSASASSQPAPRAGSGGGRTARATGTRSFPNFPWQFTLENCQLPPASPQPSFSKLESSHVFGEPTLRQNVASRNRKTFQSCAETVDDETSLWKAEENCGGIAATKMLTAAFQ
jgi:hypothetical protein